MSYYASCRYKIELCRKSGIPSYCRFSCWCSRGAATSPLSDLYIVYILYGVSALLSFGLDEALWRYAYATLGGNYVVISISECSRCAWRYRDSHLRCCTHCPAQWSNFSALTQPCQLLQHLLVESNTSVCKVSVLEPLFWNLLISSQKKIFLYILLLGCYFVRLLLFKNNTSL